MPFRNTSRTLITAPPEQQKLRHQSLSSGIELATEELSMRHAVALEIRLMAGLCYEPEDRLGLARLVEETIDKGTEKRTGRELSDAFDALGARRSSWTGRESMGFTCLCLPEYFDRVVDLHAELLRQPTFPQPAFEVNVALTRQEHTLLEDDAQALTERAMDRQGWGAVLGRHPLGELPTLDHVRREELVDYWRTHVHPGRMQVAVAGPIETEAVAASLDRAFDGFGESRRCGRDSFPVDFHAQRTHLTKPLEQQQIALCYPGVALNHPDFPVETVLVKILSGGMSSRLFTEVREKRGLVYWVSAWQETIRGAGMICFGASSTPENCEETFVTLLREVERLRDDLTEDELERALAGIAVRSEVGGDVTRARCGELASDMFYRGRLIPRREKLDRVLSVTIEEIHRYLDTHPRNAISVVTLGPKPLDG